MINYFKFLILSVYLRFVRLLNVIIPILRNQVSYYPKSVKILESKFADHTGASHSIMFSNATSAIEAALFALDIKHTSVVGSPAFVIPSSYSSASALGATLKFLDVSSTSLNVDVKLLEDGNPLGLDALIVTHFYGNPCDMVQIMKWAKKHKVKIIEDCSHAHGARIQNKSVGTWGDVGVFSLQGAKAVSAGEGGVAVTNNSKLAWKMSAYGHQQSYKKFSFGKDSIPSGIPEYGYGRKMRAHPLGAVLALVDIKQLANKNRIFSRWTEEVSTIANKSNIFYIPKPNKNALKGGYCQGMPLIFKNSKNAKEFSKVADAEGITVFMRDYSKAINFYTSSLDNKESVNHTLTTTYQLFKSVVFVPFEQFAIPFKWSRFLKILAGL